MTTRAEKIEAALREIAGGSCCGEFVNGCPVNDLCGDRNCSCARTKAARALALPADPAPASEFEKAKEEVVEAAKALIASPRICEIAAPINSHLIRICAVEDALARLADPAPASEVEKARDAVIEAAMYCYGKVHVDFAASYRAGQKIIDALARLAALTGKEETK